MKYPQFRVGNKVEILSGKAEGLWGKIASVDKDAETVLVTFADLEQNGTFSFADVAVREDRNYGLESTIANFFK